MYVLPKVVDLVFLD